MEPLLESKHLPLNYFSNAITYFPVHSGYNVSPELFFFLKCCQEFVLFNTCWLVTCPRNKDGGLYCRGWPSNGYLASP